VKFANLAKESDCAACDRPPIGAIDAAPIGRTGTVRDGAGDFDPPILKTVDESDQFRRPIAGAVDVLTS
jgi:hypothetical protein